MASDAIAPLFYPFETGDLDMPGENARALLLGARPGLRPPGALALNCVQGFRPDYLALQRAGLTVSPVAAGGEFDLAMVLADRHRGQNEMWLAEAIERVKPGGLVVVAGGKSDGIASLRKRLEAEVPLDGHLSKNHGMVFWLKHGAEADAFAARIRREERPLVEGRFVTAPGMFSHDRGRRWLGAASPIFCRQI